MILLIDAYNVIKQQIAVNVSERQRMQFIQQLAAYKKSKGHKIIAVFDAGPYDRSSQESIAGITVIYSGIHESADDYIRRYIQEHKNYEILLVSTDRSLCSWAKKFNIESIDSHDFYAIVRNIAAQAPSTGKSIAPIRKTTTSKNEELDALMQESVDRVPLKAEDIKQERKSPQHHVSKKERSKIKKIKKL